MAWVFDRSKLFYGCFRCSNRVLSFPWCDGVLEVFERCFMGCSNDALESVSTVQLVVLRRYCSLECNGLPLLDFWLERVLSLEEIFSIFSTYMQFGA